MKIKTVLLSVLFFANLTLAESFFVTANTNSGSGRKPNKTTGASTAIVFSVNKYVNISFKNPYTSKTMTVSAGTFKGQVDGQNANFYCIDISHSLAYNHAYTDEDETPSLITYILNNYYPYKTYPYTGSLGTESKEAAAVQVAIWHFADGVDISTVNNAEIKTRALAIVADAELNAGNVSPVKTLIITPIAQSLPMGSTATFVVEAYDEENNPAENVTVNLSTTTGILSAASVVTNANGVSDEITLTQGNSNSTIITATATVVIPQGTKYFSKTDPNGKQKLVLATPATATKEFFASVNWYEQADLKIVKTCSSIEPGNGEELVFTITITNDGPSDASGVIVKDILTEGFEYISSSPSGVYNNASGIWNVGSIASGASASLLINVKVNVDNLLTNTYDLGPAKEFNVFIFEDITQPSSDTEGKMAVGRNATLSNYSVGDKLNFAEGEEDVLVVGRKLTYTSGAVYGGNVVYGLFKDMGQSVSITGGTVRQDTVIDFAAAENYLTNLSNQIFVLEANGTTKSEWGGLFLTGNDPFINVFSVDGDALSTANNFEIDVPNGSVVLVNIDGTDISWTGGLTVKGTAINNVLYNFHSAQKLKIQGIDVTGSILAPKAHVDFVSGVQNGQMIAKSLEGIGQFNNKQFHGNIPGVTVLVNTAEITAADQPDPDSTPGNGIEAEDDYSKVIITVHYNTGGNPDDSDNEGEENEDGNWENDGSFASGEMIWTMINKEENILAGTIGGKIYISNEDGWKRINEDMNTAFIWSLAVNGDYIYAGTEQGLFKSEDNGQTWSLTNLTGKDVRSVIVKNNVIYAGLWGYGVYSSVDNGNTWNQVNDGLTNLAVHALAYNSDSKIFAGTFGSGVSESEDINISWKDLVVGYNFVWALGVTSDNNIFAGTYGGGVYRSLDNGQTWSAANNGLPSLFIYSVVVGKNDVIYVSTFSNGIYSSTDKGETWTKVGLADVEVSCVFNHPLTNAVYAATRDGSLFMLTSSVTSVQNEEVKPTEYALEQNYPNPFNPSTKIQFSIPKEGIYSIKIYNMLGELVKTLANNTFEAGIHSIEFNASQYASGIYIYRLTGNNVNISKKMILAK